MKTFLSRLFTTGVLISAIFVSTSIAQTKSSAMELFQEVNNYVRNKTREEISKGKRIGPAERDEFEREKKSLAGKSAAAVSAGGSNLSIEDLLYLGLLYDAAENDTKALETFQRFLTQIPPETVGNGVQLARSKVLLYTARKKKFDEMEKAFDSWVKGKPFEANQKPNLEGIMAAAYYKDGKYEQAIKYAESAFEGVKNLEAKTWAERNTKTDVYGNLVEILVLSYQKAGRKEDAINVLAEGRALSFTIPSANLYRKVMAIVDGSGVSEKKLMQKVESIKTAAPAPELIVKEWVEQEPTTLENLRGKVVLLDFWATWCGPCISTFPRLRDWHKKYGPNGLVIVGVTQYYGKDGDRPLTQLQELDFLRDFKKKYKLPYGIAVADGRETPLKYGVAALPTTVLLDRRGVVRYIGIGAGAEESENLEDMINKVIKEQQ